MKKTIIGILFLLSFISIAKAQPASTKFCTIEEYTSRGFEWNIVNGVTTYNSLVKLTLTKRMEVFLSHCDSYLEDGYQSSITISPGRYGDETSHTSIDCGSSNKAELKTTLPPGVYSITSTVTGSQRPGSSGGSQRAQRLYLSITTCRPFAPIDGKSNPEDLGELIHCEKIHKEFNTYEYKDTYQFDPDLEQSSGDVWLKFYLSGDAKVIFTTTLKDMPTYSVLLDRNNNPIADPSAILPQGIYYFVCGGKDIYTDGILSTDIEAQYQTFLGDATVVFPAINSNLNYVAKTQMTVPTGSSGGINLTPQNSITSLTCFDGLGRITRTIDKGITPSGQDLVKLIEYLNLDLVSREWNPVPYSGESASDTYSLISAKARTFYDDQKPHTGNTYERSPLDRILQQYGQGEDWLANNKCISFDYSLNKAGSCCRFVVEDGNYLVYTDSHPANSLFVKQVSDEDGRITYEYSDNLGRTILSRRINNGVNHDTYFVYDNSNKLRVVMPPVASDNFIAQGMNKKTPISELQYDSYIYIYNSNGQCITKGIPGKGLETYSYDKTGRMIFSRDADQTNKGKCRFYLYDKMGREVITGICSYYSIYEDELTKTVTAERTTGSGWMNTGYAFSDVSIRNIQLHTVNYYDNYDYQSLFSQYMSGMSFKHKEGYDDKYTFRALTESSAKSLLTGTRVWMLDSSGREIFTAFYYDAKDRLVQKQEISSDGKKIQEYYGYDFAGNIIHKYNLQSNTQYQGTTTEYTYTYDHAGRLKKVSHRVNGSRNEMVLSEIVYDELGRKQSQSLLNDVETLQYSYNIRNWLKSISGTDFAQELYYNTVCQGAVNSTPQYNGNISVMAWRTGNDMHRGYVYTYDDLNRLSKGTYFEFGPRHNPRQIDYVNGPFYNESFTYDKMGNVMTLVRTGLSDVHNEMREAPHVPGGPPCAGYVCAVHQYGEIDNLRYTRSRNQLRRINDSAVDPLYEGAFDFTDGVNEGIEYRYDSNGNIIEDKNKGIDEITWNALQLPKKITFANGHRIKYTYDALGVKHQVKYITAGEPVSMVLGSTVPGSTPRTESVETVDYCGETIYRDGKITILTENGYIGEGSEGRFTYHTYLSDYQGNIRGVLDNAGRLLQVNHYYPSGLSFAEKTGPEIQPRKYNGKELDRTHGVNIYDYGWRMYDPAILEWWGVDKLAEKYYDVSPYSYCLNNPISNVDPDGRFPFFLVPLAKGAIGAAADVTAQVMVGMANGQGFGEAVSNIDYTSVGASFVTSAIVAPGMSTAAKITTATTITIDAMVDVSSNEGVKVVGQDKTFTKAAIDAAVSVVPGKILKKSTSSLDKAITTDLGSKTAAILTKETKTTLKQVQATITGENFQFGANTAADFTGSIIGGQTNILLDNQTNIPVTNNISPEDPGMQKTDATRVYNSYRR